MKHYEVDEGEIIIKEGELIKKAYIVIIGQVELISKKNEKATLAMGDFLGDIFAMQKNRKSKFTATAMTKLAMYEIDKKAMSNFIKDNPGVYMKLMVANEKLFG